jgi:D-sedoheptulose 7-phosphate isomerase
MQLDLYKQLSSEFYTNARIREQIIESVALVKKHKRVIFIGNGGSNAIASHMMEDFAKVGRMPTLNFSDGALITCFANDYGFENAIAEWLKVQYMPGDLLVAISSSGESKNIVNAVDQVKSVGGSVITLSGFKENNTLSKKGDINFHLAVSNYGVVECYHQIIIHSVLDEMVAGK